MRYLLPTPDSATETILHDLHRRDCEAVLRGDRMTMIIARLLWGETFVHAYGGNDEALPNLTKAAIHVFGEESLQSPTWRKVFGNRPLVQVVKRDTRWVEFGYKQKAKWYTEHLSCGHTLEIAADWFEDKPAKHRRCRKCGEAAYAREFGRG